MKRILKRIVPQRVINTFKHRPVAVIANVKNMFPSKGLKIIGVTGTDGKTTTVNMIYKILNDSGKKVSMISTINAVIGNKKLDTGFHVTSPSPFMIQMLLKEAKKAGSEYIILEATSHSLDQHRFLGIKFDIGVITNITHDHLDYHKSYKNYFNTKAKLIKKVKIAVLNRDNNYSELVKKTRGKILSFGFNNKADFNPKKIPLKLKLPGKFNILNALAAAAVCQSLGISTKQIIESLKDLKSLPGRMEVVSNNQGINIIIDFAHTPNGLMNALKTLKGQTKGNLIAVFGAASERDVSKRPMMGKISSELANITILTDEDPRFEDSLKIINEIASGSIKKHNLFKEPDRAVAIKMAITMAKKGDTIGIFGKGHENSMNYFGKEIPWSDKEAVLKALNDAR